MKYSVSRLAIAVVPLLLAAFTADAQPRGKVYRIGYIQTATPEEQAPLTKAFEDGLRELGYGQGRNIVSSGGSPGASKSGSPISRRNSFNSTSTSSSRVAIQ